MTEMSIEEILSAFEPYQQEYQREAVEAAIAKRDEIIPYLIRILEDVVADPQKYYDDPDGQYFAYIYAVMLLGHFKATEAHQTIIDAFSIPVPYQNIFEDVITEDLPMILYRTCNGSIDAIKAMIARRDLDEFVRGSGVRALGFAVVEGLVERGEVISFLVEFVRSETDEEYSGFLSNVVLELIMLNATEALPVIEKAFQANLIDTSIVGDFEWVTKYFARGADVNRADIYRDFNRQTLEDMHKSMEWWYSFRADGSLSDMASTSTYRNRNEKISQELLKNRNVGMRRQKQSKKKKRKAAKASRKKNRRR